MKITCRPISTYPKAETDYRREAPFFRRGTPRDGSGYRPQRHVAFDDVQGLLETELRHLGCEELVLELDVREGDIRIDGWPRASARFATPRAVLSFDSKHGPLRYACDTFTRWQDNVYAVAKGLEALRLVDRYGVTSKGEQYTGWQALPESTDTIRTEEQAIRVVLAQIPRLGDLSQEELDGEVRGHLGDATAQRETVLEALKETHPDRGGNVESFHRVQAARKVLGV